MSSLQILSPGPDITTEAKDGHYYHQKLDHLTNVARSMNCAAAAPWPTHMDGEAGWGCQVRLVRKRDFLKLQNIAKKRFGLSATEATRWWAAWRSMVTATPGTATPRRRTSWR